jgi:Arc-like DNA binding domain
MLEDVVNLKLRLPKHLHKHVTSAAAYNHRSLNSEIVHCICIYYERMDLLPINDLDPEYIRRLVLKDRASLRSQGEQGEK